MQNTTGSGLAAEFGSRLPAALFRIQTLILSLTIIAIASA
jgi:hypothetical protein